MKHTARHAGAAVEASSLADTTDQWSLAQDCDIGWWARAREWGGSFFHHPNALDLGEKTGTPLVATCVDSVGVAAFAVGIRHSCRFSSNDRHAYFPSMPVVRPGVDYTSVVRTLCLALRAKGIGDVQFDSFDAPVASTGSEWGKHDERRNEYRVMLDLDPKLLRARLSSHHQRLIQRGDRDAWDLLLDTSDEAVAALTEVSQSATVRAASRGNPFSAAPWRLAQARDNVDDNWGVTIVRAMSGETLLSAALIGWGADRAFYLGGGSTPAGYETGAASWMHWRAMLALKARGIMCYNLGGAPAGASEPTHPAHGLHRFKSAFGAGRVGVWGLRWEDTSLHNGLHHAARRLAGNRAIEHGLTETTPAS